MASAWSQLWSLVTGSNVGGKPVTASSMRDALANGQPIPIARNVESLPVGTALPDLPVARQLGDVPEGDSTKYANRYTALETGTPIGEWVSFSSTWILRAKWEPMATAGPKELGPKSPGMMYVTFLSYATVVYNAPLEIFSELTRAPSKGRYIYAHCIRNPAPWSAYTLISPPTRKVTSAIRQHHA